MGTRIDVVAVARPLFRFISGSSIKLSVKAAERCIRNTGMDPCDLGLLINTGIYRFRNIGEPAIAALIQKKIGANSSSLPAHDKNYRTTFSFDLNNGGCGWLTGIMIADRFIQSGEIKHAMVVTGDSEPFKGLSENYNFESAASAIILSKSEGSDGFSLSRSYCYPLHKDELISKTSYDNMNQRWGKRNILYVRQKESYLNLCIDCAEKSLSEFLKEARIHLNEIDLIVPSQSPAGFVSGIKKRFGMADRFVEIAKRGGKELHTAGPAFALKKVWEKDQFKTFRNILFLTVGSGISVSVALYTNP